MRLPWGGAKRATITRSQNRILTLFLTVYILFVPLQMGYLSRQMNLLEFFLLGCGACMCVCVCVRIFVCLWLSLGGISMWALWAQLRVVGNHLAQEFFILLMHVPQNQTHWCFGEAKIQNHSCSLQLR